jgi:hypothetical protein
VEFTDATGAACVPTGFTVTTLADAMEVLEKYTACNEGTATGDCETVRTEYYTKWTGCTSCGETETILVNGLLECGVYKTQADCDGAAAGTSVSPGSAEAPLTAVTPTSETAETPTTASAPLGTDAASTPTSVGGSGTGVFQLHRLPMFS